MRYPLSILCAAALTLSGLGVVGTAAAAPAPQASPTAAQAAQAVPDELVVGYVAGASAGERSRARGLASARLAERIVAAAADRAEVELVRLPQGKNRDQAVAELQSDPAVSYAEPNWVYTHEGKPGGGGGGSPLDYFSNGSLWGMYGDGPGVGATPTNQYGSQAAEAWANQTIGSANVYVGVIDEGIQFNHPDLAGQVKNPGEIAGDSTDNDGNGYVDDIHGWDFVNNDNTIYDGGTRGSLDDHGTHVSGTIGAKNEGTSSVPVTDGKQVGVVGVNQHVTLISGKFLGPNGGTLANAVNAVDYFTGLKAKGLNIVATNNSWGGGGFSQALLDAIVRAANADILFVAAAGNSGTDNDTTASYPSNYDTRDPRATGPAGPASYDAVIAVAAIDSSGNLPSWSQYGLKSVDLGAPGVGIWSTTAYNKYSSYSGTSMATPHVTGAAALYASRNPDASAADIKAAILGSTVSTGTLIGKTVTGGRLNVSGF